MRRAYFYQHAPDPYCWSDSVRNGSKKGPVAALRSEWTKRLCIIAAWRLFQIPANSSITQKTQNTLVQGALCFGGRGWIRTIVVCDNGFTVRSLWPLGNPSIINEQDYNSRIHICQPILQCRFIYILLKWIPKAPSTVEVTLGIHVYFACFESLLTG